MRLLPACLLLLAAMPAVATDLILHNGLVWTGDPARPSASALAIEDGRLTAVGAHATILAPAGPATQRTALQSHRVVPAIPDAHVPPGPRAPSTELHIPLPQPAPPPAKHEQARGGHK